MTIQLGRERGPEADAIPELVRAQRPSGAPLATVAITTKNRKDELRAALVSLQQQTVPIEVLVVDDASTDGTAAMVREAFPTVRLIRVDQSQGYIVQRNRAATNATADIILSMDDDCVIPAPDTIEQALKSFDDPSVAAIAIPHVNVRYSDQIIDRPPSSDRAYAAFSFRGCAHAVRRELFLAVGGYRECLFHQGEEDDLCIRLLDRGYVVRLGVCPPIHHLESTRRDLTRMAAFGGRNLILFTWFNVPARYLAAHLAATTFNALMWGIRAGWLRVRLRGLLSGYRDAIRYTRERRPVRPATYRLFRRLKKHGPLLLDDVRAVIAANGR